jgi:hypothetical protein
MSETQITDQAPETTQAEDTPKSMLEGLSMDHLLSALAHHDELLESHQRGVDAQREARSMVEAAIVAKATEAKEGVNAHGYEVRLNKGRAVTSYDADKIMPHLTAEQKSVACKVSYSLVAPVFAAMLNAGILPEAVNEGVTTKPAVERWEVRKAKGA